MENLLFLGVPILKHFRVNFSYLSLVHMSVDQGLSCHRAFEKIKVSQVWLPNQVDLGQLALVALWVSLDYSLYVSLTQH